MSWYVIFADASIRAVALAAMAAVLVLFFRKNPSAQHTMWTFVVIGMLSLPILRLVVPVSYTYVVQRPAAVAQILPSVGPPAREIGRRPATAPTPSPSLPNWPLYAAIAYVTGAIGFAARLILGIFLMRRLQRGSRSIIPELGSCHDLIANAGAGTRIRESHEVRVPLAMGFKRVSVLLPMEWREWPREKLRLVLAHELAHVKRHDPAVGSLAAVNKCVFWFHPLAWWLERRLAVLAEYAADDAGLAISGNAGSYASTVLELAGRMTGQSSRLIWNVPAMTGQLVARRIRRVLNTHAARVRGAGGIAARAALFAAATVLLWISLAVDLQRTVRAQAPRTEDDPNAAWFGYRHALPVKDSISPEQASQMEAQLAADPEDEATRSKLLAYYWQHQMHGRRIPLIQWLIEHHPESPLHGYEIASIFPDADIAGSSEDLRSRWMTQVDLHAGEPRVLGNAARALCCQDSSLPETIELFERARKLDPGHRTEPLAKLYSFLLWERDPKSAVSALVRSKLRESSDIELVGATARDFVSQVTLKAVTKSSSFDFAALRGIGEELVTYAQTLEPRNRAWADLMEGVKGLAAALPAEQVEFVAPRVLHIGAGVAGQMLLESAPPVYPPLAQVARIEGVVRLQVHIGTDGHVVQVSAISGHPLLIPAAIKAVKQYVYKPVMFQGSTVDAIATVDIPFHLDAQSK